MANLLKLIYRLICVYHDRDAAEVWLLIYLCDGHTQEKLTAHMATQQSKYVCVCVCPGVEGLQLWPNP